MYLNNQITIAKPLESTGNVVHVLKKAGQTKVEVEVVHEFTIDSIKVTMKADTVTSTATPPHAVHPQHSS